jgi:hypothetical protein
MWETLERDLTSPDKKDRLVGWRSVGQLRNVAPALLSPEQRQRLLDLFAEESDPDVWRVAVTALLRLPPPAEAGDRGLGAVVPPGEGALLDWLWSPFHQASVVLRGVDSARRRDEEAVIDLARQLSRRDFPHTTFLSINLRDPQWEKTMGAHAARAFLVVGRLGLYGPRVRELLGGADLRFTFCDGDRPGHLRRSQLDPVFHAVSERGRRQPYRTAEAGEERTDYGVVQRYPITYQDKEVIVVVIAGASSLGTLGAARWAARTLAEPDLKGKLVPAPPKAGTESVLEALVTVRARKDPYPQEWQPMQWDLVALYADESKWCPADGCWYPVPPQEITVVRDPEGAGRPPTVLFDGVRAGFRSTEDNSNLRLLVSICELAGPSEGRAVPLAVLAQRVWPGGAGDLNRVRSRLFQLKQIHLGEALYVNDATVTLRARVRFE